MASKYQSLFDDSTQTDQQPSKSLTGINNGIMPIIQSVLDPTRKIAHWATQKLPASVTLSSRPPEMSDYSDNPENPGGSGNFTMPIRKPAEEVLDLATNPFNYVGLGEDAMASKLMSGIPKGTLQAANDATRLQAMKTISAKVAENAKTPLQNLPGYKTALEQAHQLRMSPTGEIPNTNLDMIGHTAKQIVQQALGKASGSGGFKSAAAGMLGLGAEAGLTGLAAQLLHTGINSVGLGGGVAATTAFMKALVGPGVAVKGSEIINALKLPSMALGTGASILGSNSSDAVSQAASTQSNADSLYNQNKGNY